MVSSGYSGFTEKVNDFCEKLRQKRIVGSFAAAKGTVDLLKQIVSSSKATTAQQLLEEVRTVGVRIQSARPIGTWVDTI
jgi:translation initiation factor eIF-2B subunit beta